MAHIGIFGRRNSGKSSIINVLTGQDLAIVSDVPGTTTDPVKKTIEIFGIGPSVLIDTAGIDDEGELGKKRIQKSLKTLSTIDAAILVFDSNHWGDKEDELISLMQKEAVPFLVVHNKSDLSPVSLDIKTRLENLYAVPVLDFSTKNNNLRDSLISEIKKILPSTQARTELLPEFIKADDLVLLITPIDSEAPTGRMILPQVQAIRAILDRNAIVVDCKTEQLEKTLSLLKQKPVLTITDSQAFKEVSEILPKDYLLTSFSILLARQKGDFETYLKGTPCISNLKNGDSILILESCTHQHSCEDIGRVKIPKLIRSLTKKENLQFDFVSGLSTLPEDISKYAIVIQCGACMITQKQLHNRIKLFSDKGIPVTNYGMAIAYMHGIFERATNMF